MKPLIVVLALAAIGLTACWGGGGRGGGGKSSPENSNAAGMSGTLEERTGSTLKEAPAYESQGRAAAPVNLGAAPGSFDGEVGGVSNSFYTVTTGTGTWVAKLNGLTQESALFVYGSPDFSTRQLCSTTSFLKSTESCDLICNEPACRFGIRVFGVEELGTSFHLTVK